MHGCKSFLVLFLKKGLLAFPLRYNTPMPVTDMDVSIIPDAEQAAPQSLIRNSTLYFAGNVAAKAIGFVMIPFYARYLSTEEYGAANLIELAITLVSISFGIQSFGQSLTRVANDHPDAAGQRATMSTTLICTIVLSAVVSLLAIAAAGPIASAINLGAKVGVLRLAFAAMFFSSITEIVLIYERMQNRVRFYLTYTTVVLVITLTLNILLIGVWHLGVAGFVLSKLVSASGGSVYLTVRTVRGIGSVWRTDLARALARFGAPLVVSAACYFAIHFSDRLFLAHVSTAEVGVYALAYNFAFLINTILGDSFNKVWGVSFYSLASGEGWQDRFAQVGRWLVLVLGAGAVGISLFGRDVLVLMVPASYDPPALLLPVLVFGYYIREVGDFFNSMLLIGAGSGNVGRIAAASAVLNLALNAALIPSYGIWGAAWATFGTWAAYCAVCWAGAWRQHRVSMNPWPLTFILLLSCACLWIQSHASFQGRIAGLAFDCALFAAFLAVSWVLYLRPGERAEVVGLGAKLLVRLRPAGPITGS